MGIVFVDDTNMWSGLEDNDDLHSATQKVQEQVNLWDCLLQEVGGILQPPKCVRKIHDMIQDKKGKWGYRDAEKKKGNEKDTEEEEERDDKLDGLEMTVHQLSCNAK